MNLPNYFLADLPSEARLTPDLITEACRTLKRNRDHYLLSRSTQDIIEVIDHVANEWRHPEYPLRRKALEQGPAALGFSEATLASGLDAFFGDLTEENLHRLIAQDLGQRNRLDDFVTIDAELKTGRTAIARGPSLIAHVGAGNVPNSTLLSILLGLLVRSAQFVKCASGSTLLPRLLAHSIYDAEAKLGACLEVAEWTGGSVELEEALFAEAELVTAAGSDETLTSVRQRVPANARFVGYGHRVSFGFLAKESLTTAGLERLAHRAAADVIAWNQLGCLSPHVFYVEHGGRTSPDQFAEALAKELERREGAEPRGALSTETAAVIATRRSFYEVRAAHSLETRVWHSGHSTAWTVVYEADPCFQVSCLNRFIYVKSVASLTEVLHAAELVRGKVSTVAIAASAERARAVALELSRWGVPRVCPIGRMQSPPLTWRHDGRPALGDLTVWTDWEVDQD